MPENKYILIKAISHSLWKNLHHLVELLLVAEITERIPIVYWGTTCIYNEVLYNNAFDLYFEPISNYTIHDVINKDFSFYPPIWKYDNLTLDDPDKGNLSYRNTGDFIGNKANVLVSDMSIYISRIIPFIKKNHPTYGMTPIQIYRYLFNKYIKLKPDIEDEIQQYYETHLKNAGHTLAVHLPGSFTLDIYPQIQRYNMNQLYHPVNLNRFSKAKKVKERMDHFKVDETVYQHEIVRLLDVTKKGDPYKRFNPEINRILKKYNINKIFLITDYEDVVDVFSKEYSNMLIYNNYDRIPCNGVRKSEYFETFLNMRRKGIDILKDTYIAAKCEFFIGYGFSNLSYGVTHLKDWDDSNIKLNYWMYRKLYNFSYEIEKTGRYSPEEADGKYKLVVKKTVNSIKKLQSVFK